MSHDHTYGVWYFRKQIKRIGKKVLKEYGKKNAKNTKPYHQLKVFSKTKVFSILQNSSKSLIFDHYGIVEPYHFIEIILS